MAVGRNDPCPCGSGLKYKNCCWKKSIQGRWLGGSHRLFLSLGAVIVVLASASWMWRSLSSPGGAPPGAPAGRGPAPPGQVWSEEHGHYHDAPTATIPTTPQATVGKAPPPGPAPPGKEWNWEHGHYHNIAPTTAVVGTTRTPEPPGPTPEGKVWSEAHGHYHDVPMVSATIDTVGTGAAIKTTTDQE